jgi:hypothetical protein
MQMPKKKKFATHFDLTFFQHLKTMNVLQPKLSSVKKPYSIYREMLIDITWEFGEVTILIKLSNIREAVQSYDICRATHDALIEHL